MLAVYHFVFTSVFRVGAVGQGSFLAFVAVALWPWLAAQEALSRATTSLQNYAGLIGKAAFPREIVVYASVAATFALHFAGYVVVLLLLAALGEPLHLAGLAVAVPVWLVLMAAATGVGLVLASLQVYVRDVEHVLAPLLMILMYLTPILYPLHLVPAGVRAWAEANPFAWIVARLREALLDGRLALQWSDALAALAAAALFALGLAFFRRLAVRFEDFV